MAESTEIHIKNIQIKLQLLLKKYAAARKENSRLEKENSSFKMNEKMHEEKIRQLEQQVHILKTSTGELEGKEKKDFEVNISRYIKSIDKCISILNN